MYKTYKPTWNSLATHPVASDWFREAKFGIYTHWGVYSVPACGPNGAWYPHMMYGENMFDQDPKQYQHHLENYGKPSEFGYKDFIPMFKAEKFDPDYWADLFKRAGAKFAGPVAELHDGFSMWDSKVNKFNAAKMGPGRDIVGQLRKSITASSMKFITTMHHSFNWWFYPTWKEEFDCSDPAYIELYSGPHEKDARPSKEYLDRWKAKLHEVVDNYQPDLIWFDFGLGKIPESYKKDFLAYYYNKEKDWQKQVMVTYKAFDNWHNLPPNTALLDLEVGKMNEMTNHMWLSDTTVDAGPGGCWTHANEIGYKSVERLIHNLVDRVSKNGYLLLNVGPRADGSIPRRAEDCLLGIGKWLEINGEAIYSTTPWVTSGEGPTTSAGGGHFNETGEARFTAHDIRFTVKDENLYAICLGQPGDQVVIKSLSVNDVRRQEYDTDIKQVTLLGDDKPLNWQLSDEGLIIDVPQKMPCEHACTFKIAH